MVLPFLRNKLDYDPLADLKPIAMAGSIRLVLVASPAAKISSYAEFVAAAKAAPGRLNYASNGVGAGLHIAMERLQRVEGIRLNHVPYKGSGPALVDMLGGQISLMWDTVPSSLPHLQSGKLVALAAGGLQPSPQLPGGPTVAELGHPGFDVDLWIGGKWVRRHAGAGRARNRAKRREAASDQGVRGPAARARLRRAVRRRRRVLGAHPRGLFGNKALFSSLGIRKE